MDEKNYLAHEIMAFISKSGMWIVTIVSGVVAKISLDVINGRKMTAVQRLAVTGISFFGGYLTAIYCTSNGMDEQGKWMVPLATLFSETVIMWVVNNHKRIFFHLLSFFTKSNNDNNQPPVQ